MKKRNLWIKVGVVILVVLLFLWLYMGMIINEDEAFGALQESPIREIRV